MKRVSLLLGALFLLCICATFQSCHKESEYINPLLGSWELDHSEYKTPNGELFTRYWDTRQILTFKENSATMDFITDDGTTTIPFGYYLENGVLHYNAYLDLSYNGESVRIIAIDQSSMRLLYRSQDTPWEETFNPGQEDEKTAQIISEVDIYVRK